MKIVFPVMGAENISVCYLSTVLKQAGHTVKVAFDRAMFDDKQYFTVRWMARLLSDRKKMVKAIIRERPDVLAMSSFTDNYQWCLDVVRDVRKQHDCITVWGGMHPTACPETVIERDEVDYLIVGEGEAPICELLEALESGRSTENIANLWSKRDGEVISNAPRMLMAPAEFPEVDKTLYEKFVPMDEYYLTVTSKGCIAFCSYCMQNYLKRWESDNQLGPFLREKSVDDVLDEFKAMKRRYNLRYIDIKNNVLSGNKRWYTEFLQRYPKEVGLPFRIMGHPLLFQGDLAAKLKAAGCQHIQIGIESFNPKVREDVLLRKESNEQIIDALDKIDDAGINFSADLIVGLPGESEEDLIYSLDVLAKYKHLIRASIFWLQYIPKVDITARAMQAGRIDEGNYRMIVEGLQENYLSTGSPMEAERKRILKTYHILFRLLPVTSTNFMRWLLRTKRHRLIRYIPFQVAWIIVVDVLVSYVRGDYYAKWIMKWYFTHMWRKLTGRVKVMSD